MSLPPGCLLWLLTSFSFFLISFYFALEYSWLANNIVIVLGEHEGTQPYIHMYLKVKVTQSCLTLCDPMDYTVHGILQATILEWVAFPFSRGSSKPRDWTQASRIAGGFFTDWATREAHINIYVYVFAQLFCHQISLWILEGRDSVIFLPSAWHLNQPWDKVSCLWMHVVWLADKYN